MSPGKRVLYGYQYNSDVEIVSYTGFTETLNPSGYIPNLRRSTPAGSNQSLNHSPSSGSYRENQDGNPEQTVQPCRNNDNQKERLSSTHQKNYEGNIEVESDLPPQILAQSIQSERPGVETLFSNVIKK